MFKVIGEEPTSSVDPVEVLLLALKSRKMSTLHVENETVFPGAPGSILAHNEMNKYILQSMGQSLHVTSHFGKIIYWNPMAEQLFGYKSEETLGRIGVELLCPEYIQDNVVAVSARVWMGDSWTGQLPMKKRTGEVFMALLSCSPLSDDNDQVVGVVTISIPFPGKDHGLGDDPHRHMYMMVEQSSSDTTDVHFGLTDIMEETEVMQSQQNPFQFSERGPTTDPEYSWKTSREPSISCLPWPGWAQGREENGDSEILGTYTEKKVSMSFRSFDEIAVEAQPRWGPSTSCSNVSRSSSLISGREYELLELLHFEIPWREIELGQKVGQGSCGTVYHGTWLGSDVAIKMFSQRAQNPQLQLLDEFRREVAIIRRLSHPNILQFMGVVSEPDHQSMITEFLPRGSLYRLLHRESVGLTWNRRLQMALDVALGMNYLHHRKPPIIHRDLKSSNLLVGRDWTVKVGDFGLSRLKNSAYLTKKCEKGTAQWMSPEVLRNEPFTEKSDVFSFGVILWELATKQIPWLEYNFLEVIGAVGIMDRRLDIPDNVDPQWAKLIRACWSSDPRLRPSFDKLVSILKAMQKPCSPALSRDPSTTRA